MSFDQEEKKVIGKLAEEAMEELLQIARAGERLWTSTPDHGDIFSHQDYLRIFPHRGSPPPPPPAAAAADQVKPEVSRESAVVKAKILYLIEALMNVDQWTRVFNSIVLSAKTLEVLSNGEEPGNFNGALQLMSAEFQMPSPLVPTRANNFVRYCKHHSDGTWVVVDVSLDHLRPGITWRCKRRPSGCLIEEVPNGDSKVIWVEHVEVDDRDVPEIYKPLVNAGIGFGAKRWVATLGRMCERLDNAMANRTPPGSFGVITRPQGRAGMLKLAERMVARFHEGVGASTTQIWTNLSRSGADGEVRIKSRKIFYDPGTPPGIVLSGATSFQLPVPPKRVFEFLRDENSRKEWDILSMGRPVQQIGRIMANGHDPENSVSLLRVHSPNSSESSMMILQESCTDSTGSYVIYAPVDPNLLNMVLRGDDSDNVAFLPSGFAILPDGPISQGGTLLTVAFQILVDSNPTATLSLHSVATVNSLIMLTVERIKNALGGENML